VSSKPYCWECGCQRLYCDRDSDTQPKAGDVKQAPLVSGAGRNGIAQKEAS
jgi:hypothetical protein